MEAVKTGSATSSGSLADLLNALGTSAFESETLRYLNRTSGADHYTVYRVRGAKAEILGGASMSGTNVAVSSARGRAARSYAGLDEARAAAAKAERPVAVHLDVDGVDNVLRGAFSHFNICDRVMVCGQRVDDLYAISLLRSSESGQFEEPEVDRLNEAADMLIAAFAKHADFHWDRRAINGFDSVAFIEGKLRESDWRLTERELQVSARILYGISAVGIALDLGLGEETIATYRKRAYQRLGIGSRHELFQLYLGLL